MAARIEEPRIRVMDANGLPYVGAKLYVYDAGTTTPASIFSDSALTVPAANPLTSDASGYFELTYIAAGEYKLRAEQSDATLIWEKDNQDTGVPVGAGALAISAGGTGATTAAAARTNLDVPSNSELTALSASVTTLQTTVSAIVGLPQGRLTPTTAVPVITSGVTSGTAVYYTPYVGNVIPIYNGTTFATKTFAELTLTLNTNHLADTAYDVFIWLESGVVTIGTGPAWNNSTGGSSARGSGASTTELEYTNGLLTNAQDVTMRNGATTYSVGTNLATYVGSILIDGTAGQISCLLAYGQNRIWGVWNAYNRVPIIMKAGDSTASWAYSTATIRASNNSASNRVSVFCGLAEEMIHADFLQNITRATNPGSDYCGIGWNSTTAASGILGARYHTSTTADPGLAHGRHVNAPAIGRNNVTSLERASGSTTATWLGGEDDMILTVAYRG